MPSTWQTVIGNWVTARTLCATTAFFLRSPGLRVGSRLPSFSGPARARAPGSSRRPRAIGWRGRRPHWPGRRWSRLGEPLPVANHAWRDIELAAELGQCLLAGQDSLDRRPLELRA